MAVLCLGVALSVAVAWWFFAEARATDAARFEAAVAGLRNTLDERTERYALELESFTARVANLPNVSPESWKHQIDLFAPKGKLPALIELAYCVNPALASRAEVEKAARHPRVADDDGSLTLLPLPTPQLRVANRSTWDTSVSAAETEAWLRADATAVDWVSTFNGQMIASQKRALRDENGKELQTFSFFFPIFADDLVELMTKFPKITYRHFYDHRFKALIVATIDWNALVGTALGEENKLVAFDAYAGLQASPTNWMGRFGALDNSGGERRPKFVNDLTWRFFRQRWILRFATTNQFDKLSPAFRGWVALSAGSLLSFLMCGLVGVQIHARGKQEIISEELQSALDQLKSARSERERLNHDLHDGTIQSLYALQLGLSRSVEIAFQQSPQFGERLEDHRRVLNSVITELRGFILRHEAEGGPSGDLASVIEALAQRLRPSTDKKIRTELSREAARKLSAEQAVHLANLTREALSNAMRHSDATTISIRLAADSTHATIEIQDDGVGFNLDAPGGAGVGLTSMAARAKHAGGVLDIDSPLGSGTLVRVVVPLTHVN